MELPQLPYVDYLRNDEKTIPLFWQFPHNCALDAIHEPIH
jgi:hypothetical protein